MNAVLMVDDPVRSVEDISGVKAFWIRIRRLIGRRTVVLFGLGPVAAPFALTGLGGTHGGYGKLLPLFPTRHDRQTILTCAGHMFLQTAPDSRRPPTVVTTS